VVIRILHRNLQEKTNVDVDENESKKVGEKEKARVRAKEKAKATVKMRETRAATTVRLGWKIMILKSMPQKKDFRP
jgi:hypothetical protein